MTFGELVDHYTAKELQVSQDEARKLKAYSTIESNRRYLRRWIVPRWGRTPISEIEPIAIEEWLFELGKEKKLANGTRLEDPQHHECCISPWNALWISSQRYRSESHEVHEADWSLDKEHTILTPDQAMAVIAYLPEPMKTMALLDASTGLRASELKGLRWEDVDFNAGILHIRRGVVYSVIGVVGEVKTDASRTTRT